MKLNLKKLFQDVFHIESDERVLVAVDTPNDRILDNPVWVERRKMAEEWHSVLCELSQSEGFSVLPILNYPATGGNNADLPSCVEELFEKSTLVIALAEYSPSAFLVNWSKTHADFRAASLPGVTRGMEETGLAADYGVVAKRCKKIAELFEGVSGANVKFSTGHKCFFDLRFRKIIIDDGQLPRDKSGLRLINLPSGEVCMAPYEGERAECPSKTKGEIPVMLDGEFVVFSVSENKIVDVSGVSSIVKKWKNFFAADPARTNIAEFAVGCNSWAKVTGIVLEDEKAGFHWAYGRSDQLGGIVKADMFASPKNVVHQDIVYSKESPIQVEKLVVICDDNPQEREIIKNKELLI